MPGKSLDALFQETVAAIDRGDLPAVEQLLRAHPELVRRRLKWPGRWLRDALDARTLRGLFRHPYLLWFVAEDAVRAGTLPSNIAAIARAIIEAAVRERVDSLAEQLHYTLRMVAWSGVAAKCGVQIELIDVLIDAGASPDEVNNALVNGHVAAAEHLVRRGGRMSLGSALVLDRWDAIPSLYATAADGERRFAFVLASLNGKAESLRRMIALGADVNARSEELYPHGTPLHHAVCSGSLEAVRALVEAGAGINQPDLAWKATPLGWARHYVEESKDATRLAQYQATEEYLAANGG